MDPLRQFCHNADCPDQGQPGRGNIRIHSRTERRYRCTTCSRTSAATSGTPLYRLEKPGEVVTLVLTLLGHGCPLQAIVAAFGLDERTVADWRDRAGRHGQQLHAQPVQRGRVDLQHVRADEVYVERAGGRLWMALALAVPSRLRLGGVISPERDPELIPASVRMVRSCAVSSAIPVRADGLASYVTAFLRAFRDPVRTGRRGRPRQVVASGLLIGQAIKRHAQRRVIEAVRRVVRGTAEATAAAPMATGTGTGIDTAYIERLDATFRGSLAPLVRRGRAIAHAETTLTAGMYPVGCAYNFCWHRDSLRLAAPAGAGCKWQERTPAMAAGLTDHRWTMQEVLSHAVAPPKPCQPRRARAA